MASQCYGLQIGRVYHIMFRAGNGVRTGVAEFHCVTVAAGSSYYEFRFAGSKHNYPFTHAELVSVTRI